MDLNILIYKIRFNAKYLEKSTNNRWIFPKKEIERLYIYSNNKIKNLSNNRSLVLHEY